MRGNGEAGSSEMTLKTTQFPNFPKKSPNSEILAPS